MEKLTASVVGGGTGGRLSMDALAGSHHFDLVAAADLQPGVRQALEAQYPGIRTFASHQEMFAAVPTDVVCVSTYPASHEEVTRDALDTPLKGILVEKPLGHTAASGRRIVDAVKQKGIPMAVPHGLRAMRTPLEVIDKVQRGKIGALKLVEVENNGWDLLNGGIDWLDFFVTVTGNEPLAWVMCLCDTGTRTVRDGLQVETMGVTYAVTRSGVRIVMNTGDEVPVNEDGKSTLFRLIGTKGLIEFWGWENGYLLEDASHPTPTLVKPEEFSLTGHHLHLEKLATAIAHDQPDYRTAESSLTALEVCEGAYLSSKHHCRVTFPLDQFDPPPPSDWEPGQPYAGAVRGQNGQER